MIRAKCKICRRAGQKLLLKAERCASPKCGFVRRPYPPGVHGQKSRRRASEFGAQLAEKRKLEAVYLLDERDLNHLVKAQVRQASKKNIDLAALIVRALESRLDNVVFRLGLAPSRIVARQFVAHGHVRVNGRRTNVPSVVVRPGDTITVRSASLTKAPFRELSKRLASYTPPSWLELDRETLSGKALGWPASQEIVLPADVRSIIAYYSR